VWVRRPGCGVLCTADDLRHDRNEGSGRSSLLAPFQHVRETDDRTEIRLPDIDLKRVPVGIDTQGPAEAEFWCVTMLPTSNCEMPRRSIARKKLFCTGQELARLF
jgi:hypothetical protein